MKQRLLGVAVSVAAAAAGIVVAATPAFANNTCGTAVPMGTGYEMGTVSQNDTVGILPNTDIDWWEHSTGLVGRSITATAPAGGQVDLTVYASDCTTVLCATTTSPATCTSPTLPAGTLKIKVQYQVLGGGSATAYNLTATGQTPTECSDGVDNDGDGWVDLGDPNCTSHADNTEAPIHVAAYGHITITANPSSAPTYTTSGVYADTTKFHCSLSYSPYIEVVCVDVFDPEITYECTHFILTASAPAPTQTGTGDVHGYVGCASGSIATADVNGTGSAWADNTASGTNLGPAHPVTCRAGGVSGAALPSGTYRVDCYEPGVAWPYGEPPVRAGG